MKRAPVSIAEWIDERQPPVPPAFRPYLETPGPASPDGFAAAAAVAMKACARMDPNDRAAAFLLLAADAFITYACQLALLNGEGGPELRRLARRVAEMDAAWSE